MDIQLNPADQKRCWKHGMRSLMEHVEYSNTDDCVESESHPGRVILGGLPVFCFTVALTQSFFLSSEMAGFWSLESCEFLDNVRILPLTPQSLGLACLLS
ncbi:hypothetical protein RRG08_020001 [Elysia crispata]|uniref:Uncharacterized protein n=1 Tax=Elysia crispata TaxID=231223 RepID=A0AAE1BBP4_9GAST|nr:hypothetical protein RRG08_020001 [Elysia crispata]